MTGRHEKKQRKANREAAKLLAQDAAGQLIKREKKKALGYLVVAIVEGIGIGCIAIALLLRG